MQREQIGMRIMWNLICWFASIMMLVVAVNWSTPIPGIYARAIGYRAMLELGYIDPEREHEEELAGLRANLAERERQLEDARRRAEEEGEDASLAVGFLESLVRGARTDLEMAEERGPRGFEYFYSGGDQTKLGIEFPREGIKSRPGPLLPAEPD